MNNLDKDYCDLLQDILDNGTKKQTRNGEVLSLFGRQIRHKMSDGFPLLTTKKMYWKGIVTELLWFLRGDTNIKYLVDNDCHIWDGDAYKAYVKYWEPNIEYIDGKAILTQEEFINKIKTDDEFAKKWGELGPIYGKQWRSWKSYKHKINYEPYIPVNKDGKVECYVEYVDQIANLINEIKTNPDSRRLMVSAWNVAELDQCVLPPCHYGFQVYTRELSSTERYNLLTETEKKSFIIAMRPMMSPDDKYDEVHYTIDNYYKHIPTRAISLMWSQRSVDTGLGLPFNIASYGLLLEIIAKTVNMVPDELIGNLGDVHLYSNHIEQAKEQITREPMKLPTLRIKQHSNDEPSAVIKPQYWHPEDFVIDNYQSHPAIKAPLSN
jgi:thymidylate synthase